MDKRIHTKTHTMAAIGHANVTKIICCFVLFHVVFFVRFSSGKRIRVTASLNFTSRTCAFTFHAHVNDNKYTGSDYRFLCNRHLFDDLKGNVPSQNVEFFSSFRTNDKWFMDYSFFQFICFLAVFSLGRELSTVNALK